LVRQARRGIPKIKIKAAKNNGRAVTNHSELASSVDFWKIGRFEADVINYSPPQHDHNCVGNTRSNPLPALGNRSNPQR